MPTFRHSTPVMMNIQLPAHYRGVRWATPGGGSSAAVLSKGATDPRRNSAALSQQ